MKKKIYIYIFSIFTSPYILKKEKRKILNIYISRKKEKNKKLQGSHFESFVSLAEAKRIDEAMLLAAASWPPVLFRIANNRRENTRYYHSCYRLPTLLRTSDPRKDSLDRLRFDRVSSPIVYKKKLDRKVDAKG